MSDSMNDLALALPEATDTVSTHVLTSKPEFITTYSEDVQSETEFNKWVSDKIGRSTEAKMFIKQYRAIGRQRLLAFGKIQKLLDDISRKERVFWDVSPSQWTTLFREVMKGLMNNLSGCMQHYADEEQFLQSWKDMKEIYTMFEKIAKEVIHIHKENERKQELIALVLAYIEKI